MATSASILRRSRFPDGYTADQPAFASEKVLAHPAIVKSILRSGSIDYAFPSDENPDRGLCLLALHLESLWGQKGT
jgi:hypothetical protein